MRPRARITLLVRALAASIALLAMALPAAGTPRATIDVSIVSVSDWHGQLEPIGGLGGASVLSSYFKAERAANPNTLVVTAGDAIGASPPLSSFFGDEPAIKALNLMGVNANTLGNHEFDGGVRHLRELMDLADYPYVSANLDDRLGELPEVAPFVIQEVGGVKIGIVGVTNPEASTLVFPGSMGGVVITDPIPAANRARAAAQAAGAKVTIALTHMGIEGFDPATGSPFGPLVHFAENVGGFDVIVGDHTNVQFEGVINGARVVENLSKGVRYARTTLTVDPLNGRVAASSTQFVLPRAANVVPDPLMESMLDPYRRELQARMDGVVGEAANLFPRAANIERLREVALGNLVADALRARYGTQIAFVNGGGLRAPLPSSYTPKDTTLRRTTSGYRPGPPYDLVSGDVYTVLPFGNAALTRTMTGRQLLGALENSVSQLPAASGRFLQISGFRYRYDSRLPAGSRVVSAELDDGTPIASDATYTAATVDFLNAGGDGYAVLADGNGTTRELLAQVLVEHIRRAGTVTPVITGRIVDVATV